MTSKEAVEQFKNTKESDVQLMEMSSGCCGTSVSIHADQQEQSGHHMEGTVDSGAGMPSETELETLTRVCSTYSSQHAPQCPTNVA